MVFFASAQYSGSDRVWLLTLVKPEFELNLIITRKGQAAAYAGHLRIRWGDAPTYSRAGGDQCPNPHFNAKTGGRAGSAIYADLHLRQRGRVKCFAATGQYGFIVPDKAGGPEVFFHISEALDHLNPHDPVSYFPRRC